MREFRFPHVRLLLLIVLLSPSFLPGQSARRLQSSDWLKLHTVGDFLRNPADKRDWNASPRTAGERRGTSDRFALQFVKPARNFSPAPGG